MTCQKHGWVGTAADCISCLDERRQEAQRRERFVFMAAIYFYERRRWYGIPNSEANDLRMESWKDAEALYDSKFCSPPGPDNQQPPVMP